MLRIFAYHFHSAAIWKYIYPNVGMESTSLRFFAYRLRSCEYYSRSCLALREMIGAGRSSASHSQSRLESTMDKEVD